MSCIRNSWDKWAQTSCCISLPGAALHSPVLDTLRSTCRTGLGRHGLPKSLSFARQPAVLCPKLWSSVYSRPDGVGEEDGCTQEGWEAQKGDEDSTHARCLPGLAGGLAVLHQAGLQTGSRVLCAAVSWGAAPGEQVGQLPQPTVPSAGSWASLGTPCPQQHLLPPTMTALLAAWCSTSAVTEAACSRAQHHCRAAHHRDTWGAAGQRGCSHLFDIEQQQQLQRLHSRQERCEENAQPEREGKTSLSQVWALQELAGGRAGGSGRALTPAAVMLL